MNCCRDLSLLKLLVLLTVKQLHGERTEIFRHARYLEFAVKLSLIFAKASVENLIVDSTGGRICRRCIRGPWNMRKSTADEYWRVL